MASSTFHEQLLGAWELVFYTATAANDASDVIHPLGPGCRGQAIFTEDGYMSAHIQSAAIKPYSSGRFEASREELADAAAKTLTYAANYRLEVQSGQQALIYYDVNIAIPTNWVGTTEIRELKIQDDDDGKACLYLGPPGTVVINGVERKVVVKTIRAPPREVMSRL
jgi:hypothetical protein